MTNIQPTQKQFESILALLAHARLRSGMYFTNTTKEGLRDFVHGFSIACKLLGVDVQKTENSIWSERGWYISSGGSIGAMEDHGFTIEQMIAEIFTVLILAFVRQYGLSVAPILDVHTSIRERAKEGLRDTSKDTDLQARYKYELEIIGSLEKDLGIQ